MSPFCEPVSATSTPQSSSEKGMVPSEAMQSTISSASWPAASIAARAASDCMRAELAPRGVHVASLIVGSVDTRMAAHVKGREKSKPRDIAKAGLTAAKHSINEHDTDPHALEVRAFLARDPSGLAASMAKALVK